MEGNKDRQKVLVIVKGGVVQSIYVSHHPIEVEVLDFDNEDFDNSWAEDIELERLSNGLFPIL